MKEAQVVDIAAIASGVALCIVFFTCVVFSFWICHRLKKDEDGEWAEFKERRRRQRLRKSLLKQFTEKHGHQKRDRQNRACHPGSRATSPESQSAEPSCSVCLESFAGEPQDAVLGLLVACRHYFHFDCLWQWLEEQANCPMCRTEVQFSDADLRAVSFSHVMQSSLDADTSVEMGSQGIPRALSKDDGFQDGRIFHTSTAIVATHTTGPCTSMPRVD